MLSGPILIPYFEADGQTPDETTRIRDYVGGPLRDPIVGEEILNAANGRKWVLLIGGEWRETTVPIISPSPEGDYTILAGTVDSRGLLVTAQEAEDVASEATQLDIEARLETIEGLLGDGLGDVVGPASAVDGAISTFDGTTGKQLRANTVRITEGTGHILGVESITTDDGLTITSDGDIENCASLDIANAGLFIRDTDGSHHLRIQPGSNLSADRTLLLVTGDVSPTLTMTGDATIGGTTSGINTGDQTTISGNAATATALQTSRSLTLTGDVTWTSGAFDGTADRSAAASIASNAVTTAKILDANVTLGKMANLAQDQFIGRTTASTGVPETATITAAARTVLDDTTVAAMVDTLGGASSTGTGGIARATSPNFVTPILGTPTSGTLTNCTGLPVAGGGTGAATFTDGGVLIGNTTGAIQATSAGTAGQVLTSNGAGVDPTFQAAAGGGSKTFRTFTPFDCFQPTANYGTFGQRNTFPTLDFDDTTEESVYFVGVIPEAASLGSGIKVRIHWVATSATTGNCRWGVAFEAAGTDIDSDSFDTATEATTATSGTSGIDAVTEITATTIDSLAAGGRYRLKVYRDVGDAADTMAGDAQILAVEVRSAA